MKTKTEMVTIKEDFMPVETKALDSKNRVNLGEKVKKLLLDRMKVDSFEILVGKGGDLLLRPVARIPSKELWLYKNAPALAKVKKGLEEAEAGNVKRVTDLEKFLDSL